MEKAGVAELLTRLAPHPIFFRKKARTENLLLLLQAAQVTFGFYQIFTREKTRMVEQLIFTRLVRCGSPSNIYEGESQGGEATTAPHRI